MTAACLQVAALHLVPWLTLWGCSVLTYCAIRARADFRR